MGYQSLGRSRPRVNSAPEPAEAAERIRNVSPALAPRRRIVPRPQPRISVFPKCYFDDLYQRRMAYTDWIRQAAPLGAEGLEHYDGFFASLDDAGVEPVRRALAETGQTYSLLCFSPDFTHPDTAERVRQVQRQKAAIDLCVRLGVRHCRTLSGQAYPGLTRRDGVARTVDGIRRSLEYAERRGVTLCLENHY